MYKIEIISNCKSDKFEQLKELIKQFAIDIFIVQKYNLANESYKIKEEYISEYNKYLSAEDSKYLENDIAERVEFAINSINSKDENKKTRYYILVDDERVVAFQTAQVREEDGIVEGWRNFAYLDGQYRGKINDVIDSYGKHKRGLVSNVIYDNISEWFDEEKVQIERTATGRNMIKNIKIYIMKKGFVPEKYDDARIYLKKERNENRSKIELKKIYEEYVKSYR